MNESVIKYRRIGKLSHKLSTCINITQKYLEVNLNINSMEQIKQRGIIIINCLKLDVELYQNLRKEQDTY